MNRLLASASGMALLLASAGCIDPVPPASEANNPAVRQEDGRQFHERLLEIARTYETYGRLNTKFRFAPVLCADAGAQPDPFGPSSAQLSSSGDGATHGRKLYSLFVKELQAGLWSVSYTEPGKPNPVGQVVVKEAWAPEEVKDEGQPLEVVSRTVKVRGRDGLVDHTDRFTPYVRKDGRLYHAAQKAGLFIMVKLDPQTPGTDEGWVYGTVSADGKEVTSAGRVESCMACHRDAPHDRLFGLPDR